MKEMGEFELDMIIFNYRLSLTDGVPIINQPFIDVDVDFFRSVSHSHIVRVFLPIHI